MAGARIEAVMFFAADHRSQATFPYLHDPGCGGHF
jgi:hypothetical protein